MESQWVLAVLPELLLAAGGFIVLCVGAFWRRRPGEVLFLLALLTVVSTGLAAALVGPGTSFFTDRLDLTGYARFFAFLLSVITAITLLFVHQYSKVRALAGDELYGLILFATLGMLLVACAVHWLIFFLGLELLSISLYVLIAIHKGNPYSNEAGLKYFITGAVASAFLTFGIALVYAATGTLLIGKSLAADLIPGDIPILLLALSLILVGMGFKISIAPFHLWTPDVYEGAPAPVTAFLSTGSKVALFAALLRLSLHMTGPAWIYFVPALWVLAVITMLVGNVAALSQSRLKRLLAYSSVAQMGYLFMTLTAIKQGSLNAMMFYLAVYALMDLGAFGILGTFSSGSGKEGDLDALEDYQGLGYSHPWRSAILTTCLFSLAGLPPTAGFIGKFVLFRAVIRGNFVVLAVIGILTVIISIFYYVKVVVSLYMRPATKRIVILEADLSDRLACAMILILILWLGLMPSSVFAVITRIVSSVG
jgi:NADH-quinone oxidoreductase subunit N